jgi:hypothetical protein
MMGGSDIEPIALFRTMVRNRPMAEAGWEIGSYGLGRTLSLDRRLREIVIDRTSARLGCEYEWSVHVLVFAERVGLTPGQVSSLTHGTSADPCWDAPRERLVIDAVDALVGTGDIADDLWADLAGSFTQTELLDLLMLTGWYHAICFLARATRLPLEPGAPTFASVEPVRAGAPARRRTRSRRPPRGSR